MFIRRGPSSLKARTRIGLTIAATTAAALLISGLVAAVILREQVRTATQQDLTADVNEFERLVKEGIDPDTGMPFQSPEAAVRTAMERLVPNPGEGALGYVDGTLRLTTREAELDLTADTGLDEAVTPATVAAGITYMTVQTEVSTYRLAVVPVWEAAGGFQVAGAKPTDASVEPVASMVLVHDEAAAFARFRDAFVVYVWVAAAALIGTGLVALLVAGRLLRPVRVLALAARQIGRDDLSERIPVRGRDDLADMTVAVNQMLDRLEAAVRSQAHLLNDVSHELRTPITIIRGHLELMDPNDPADAREVRALGLDELDRMSRIVEDLMTLAKADRPDFVRNAALDIEDLTTTVAGKASALGERQWSVEAFARESAQGDPQRLTQAWLQLAANAVAFSPDHSPIAIGSSVAGDELRLWVTDHGRGIAPDQSELIFERFAQAGSASDGAGLGLPIVAAIALAHGGRVEFTSALGLGSTFTIVLPRGPAPAEVRTATIDTSPAPSHEEPT